MINWLITSPADTYAAMTDPRSALPPLPNGRLPRPEIRARLREIAALRRSERRSGH